MIVKTTETLSEQIQQQRNLDSTVSGVHWIPNPECYTDWVFEEQGAADKAKLEQVKAEKYNDGFHDFKEEEKFVQVEE